MALVEEHSLICQQMLDTAGYIHLTVDRQGIIHRLSPQFENLTGYSTLRHYTDLFKSDQKDPLLQSLTAKGVSEWMLITRSGKTRWVEQISVPTRDGHTDVMLRDIHERKSVEERLRLLDSAVQQTDNAVIITNAELDDPGPRIVFVNPASSKMTGYSAGELIGKTPRILQGPGTDRAVLDDLREHLQRGEYFTAEAMNYRKDGTPYIVEWSITSVYDDMRTLTHFVSVQRDVTEQRQIADALRQTQAHLKNVLESLPVALFTWDRSGTFIFGEGKETRAITGSYGDFIGRSAQEVFAHHPDIVRAIEDGFTGKTREIRFSMQQSIYEMTLSPVYNELGEISDVVGFAMDITRREQAENELRHRENLYRTLARTLPDTAVFLYDNDLRYMITEGAILERQGYQPAKMEGRTLHEVLRPQMAEQLEPLYRTALAGQQQRIEMEIGALTYATYALPVRNDSGEVFAGMLVSQDITRYKQAEKALRHSEQRVRALIQAMPDMMFVMNTQGIYVEFDNGKSMTNFLVPVRVVGMNIRDAGVPEPLVRQVFDCMENAIRTGQTQTFTYEFNVSQSLWSYEARFVALNEQEVLVIVRDITDLKQTQAELQKRINQLMILSQVETELADKLNVDYVLTMALDAAVRMSESSAGFIGLVEDDRLRLARLIGGYDETQVITAFDRGECVAARAVRQQRTEYVRDASADPDYRPMLPNTVTQIAIPLISRDTVIGVLNLESSRAGTFTEQTQEFLKLITARIAVAIDNSRLYRQTATQLTELRSLYDRVHKLEQLKTDMIRIASHDLRNPLMTIKGYVNVMRDSLQDQSLAEYLGYIDTAAGTMRRITTDILSLERIEEAAQNGNFTLFDFKTLVEEAVHEQNAQAKLKTQTLKLHISQARFMMEGDPVQLKEAVANFISNAIKYTPAGGKIDVRLMKRDDRLAYEVEDNGYGIKEAQQSRLFEPFFRSRSPETKEIEGTGLGLHLVKNIIERHGGSVYFSSVYGKGSTFGFELPFETGVAG